jgi:hypothetical protein
MSRGYHHATRPWSKLQKQLYGLMASDLPLQIHCTVYSFSTKFDTFESPRHWITLDKAIIWDFPSYFFAWIHPNVPKPVKYMEQEYWGGGGSTISQLFRQYLDTPRADLLIRTFELDAWGLVNILRAADRRIGHQRLHAFAATLTAQDPARKVLARRLGTPL